MPDIFNRRNIFKSTEKRLQKYDKKKNPIPILKRYGSKGVSVLSKATPANTGKTRGSWDYSVSFDGKVYSLSWTNSVRPDKTLLVILIEFGHGTKNGGYVYPRRFIHRALKPIFNDLQTEMSEVYR